MRKFTMELVWHNCLLYPPQEECDENLVVTDGKNVFHVKYKEVGWRNETTYEHLEPEQLLEHWWADLLQTVQGKQEFK